MQKVPILDITSRYIKIIIKKLQGSEIHANANGAIINYNSLCQNLSHGWPLGQPSAWSAARYVKYARWLSSFWLSTYLY